MSCGDESVKIEGLINSTPLAIEYERNSKLQSRDIETIRKWLAVQYHLPLIQDNDVALFLNANDYDLEKTKINIDNYFTMRTFLPEFFTSRDAINSRDLRKIFNTVSVVPLGKLTEKGDRVIYSRLTDTDAKYYHYEDAIRYLYMVTDMCIYRYGSNTGYVYVIDLSGTNQDHISKLSFLGLKKFFYYSSKGMPIKWRGLHYLAGDASSPDHAFDDLVRLKTLFGGVSDKLHFHRDKTTLSEFIPLEIFPTDIGGSAGYLKDLHGDTIEKLEKHQEWFLKVEKPTKVNEKLRPAKQKTFGVVFDEHAD